jgi:hypothetical protein
VHAVAQVLDRVAQPDADMPHVQLRIALVGDGHGGFSRAGAGASGAGIPYR